MQRTLMLIKPDAVERGLVGPILAHVTEAGFEIQRLRMVHLTPSEARSFYRVHEGKPFLADLVAFMSRSPIVACVIAGNDAVARLRRTMGATDPAKADPGTIRARFGRDIQENAVHGSDSGASAETEMAFFDLGLSLRSKA